MFLRGIVAEPAPEWTTIFERTSGWLSADGIYSVPLSGVDARGTASETSTVLFFSDTLIGEVEGGETQPGATIVNNTLAYFNGANPAPSDVRFVYGQTQGGQPRANFIPSTPNAEPDDLYWLGDAFVNQTNGTTYLFGNHLRPSSGEPFGLADVGVNVIALPAGSRPPFDDQRQIRTPLYRPAQGGRGLMRFGIAILVNTAEAGAPEPDGYVYVYGIEGINGFEKYLLAARVRPESFEEPSAWRFWNGSGWTRAMANAARITDRISNELSVTPISGRYVLAFQLFTIGRETALRVGDSPIGPFGPAHEVYTCPEPDLDPDFYCYNAKAHPHLSGPDELLITYNVNSFDFFGDFSQAYTLHPRFIRLRMTD